MLKCLVDVKRDHVYGNRMAPVQVVEYGDFHCPNCIESYIEVKKLLREMGDDINLTFRHFPNTELHPLSLDAAVACEIADRQGKFWHMHDILFEKPRCFTRRAIIKIGEDLEIDMAPFEDNGVYKKLAMRVFSDFEGGMRSGVTVTPTFFVNGLRYNGDNRFDSLQKACRYALLIKINEANLISQYKSCEKFGLHGTLRKSG